MRVMRVCVMAFVVVVVVINVVCETVHLSYSVHASPSTFCTTDTKRQKNNWNKFVHAPPTTYMEAHFLSLALSLEHVHGRNVTCFQLLPLAVPSSNAYNTSLCFTYVLVFYVHEVWSFAQAPSRIRFMGQRNILLIPFFFTFSFSFMREQKKRGCVKWFLFIRS